jgi:ABC-type transporter Mla subunit MlaD
VNKRALKKSQLAMMILFAFSCFAILLYLWSTFGGPVPLRAKGYEVQIDFAEATQLSDTADVRISGVSVGRVRKTVLHGDRTRATLEIKPEFAPLPKDTRAILRLKTLLGETYIELTPGSKATGSLPDGAQLPTSQVADTVELDEIQRALDAKTRADLKLFLKGLSEGVAQRGTDINNMLGNLHPFADDTNDLLATLDRQHAVVRQLVSDTGSVFTALGQRQGELQGLIRSGDQVLAATARRNQDLAEVTRILPTTLREARPTLAALQGLTRDATPVVRDLHPAARALGPTLSDAVALAPELEGLFRDVDRVITVSKTALPKATEFVNAARPLFQVLTPTLQQAFPVIQYLSKFTPEVVQMGANLSAATQGTSVGANGEQIHYLRALTPFTYEGLVVNGQRYGSNRHNPYFNPGALEKLADGLESIDCSNQNNFSPPGQNAPPCKVQTPLPFQGRNDGYTHVQADGSK